MAVREAIPETRGTCRHCDIGFRRPAADPTPPDRCQRCHEEITTMIRRGDDPTAGASTTAWDDQWRCAAQRVKVIGPNGCDGLHYVHQLVRLVLGNMARDGELQA